MEGASGPSESPFTCAFHPMLTHMPMQLMSCSLTPFVDDVVEKAVVVEGAKFLSDGPRYSGAQRRVHNFCNVMARINRQVSSLGSCPTCIQMRPPSCLNTDSSQILMQGSSTQSVQFAVSRTKLNRQSIS